MIYDSQDEPNEKREYGCDVHFVKGENYVTFMVRCDNDKTFEFAFMPSVRHYRMWAKYYLLHVRATSPIDEYSHEDGVGISKLYQTEQPFDGKFIYPTINYYSDEIDFEKIFSENNGVCAYALSYAKEDTVLKIKTDCIHKVFVNCKEANDAVHLRKGDVVLVKLIKGKEWKFEFEGNIGIPFLNSSRRSGDKWMTLGGFGVGNCINQKFAPEYTIQFAKPYLTSNGEKTFWKLSDSNDYIRPYLDTRFFGQWFYALMVGNYGLLKASEVLDCPEYKDYFVESTKVMAKYFEYMKFDSENFGQATFLELATTLADLDSIGSMGRNMCELFKLYPEGDVLYCIETLAKAAKENIPRFEDGTYCRPKDMWADDTFMSCPFLVRLGMIKNDKYYYEEVVRQLRGFKNRLWMQEEKIFSHIFFLDTQKPNNIPWGRGNGWVFVTLSDVLENMPEDIEGREELLLLYKSFADSLRNLQDNDGLWHQVLSRKDSYQETSCSGMFMLGLCRGLKNGWLDESYKEIICRAYKGIISNKINKDGNVFNVCMGSSNSTEVEYYLRLGTVDNDDHGTGVILAAISEMIKLLQDLGTEE